MLSSYVLIVTSSMSPLYLCISLIIQTLVFALTMYLGLSDLWPSLLVLLVFFGGVLILFLYISLLAHNDSLSLNLGVVFWLPATLTVDTYLIIWASESSSQMSTYCSVIFSNYFYALSLFLVMYLLLALVVSVKITMFYLGALRFIFNVK